MKPDQRPMAAGIASVMVHGGRLSGVYDAAAARRLKLTIEIKGATVTAYDHDRKAHVAGDLPGAVYDFGHGAHLSFDREGETVCGYDYGSGRHFAATVSGRSISLYDYEDERHHPFSTD